MYQLSSGKGSEEFDEQLRLTVSPSEKLILDFIPEMVGPNNGIAEIEYIVINKFHFKIQILQKYMFLGLII